MVKIVIAIGNTHDTRNDRINVMSQNMVNLCHILKRAQRRDIKTLNYINFSVIDTPKNLQQHKYCVMLGFPTHC